MNKKIMGLLLILGMLSPLVFAINADTVVSISDPSASQVISAAAYNGKFTAVGTDFKSFNCTSYIDGVVEGTIPVALNNTETTAAFTLTAGEPRDTHVLNVTCQNTTYKYGDTVTFIQAYLPSYATTDYAAIFVDVMASAVLFVKENITLMGTMLLAGFLMGGAIAIKLKAGRIV